MVTASRFIPVLLLLAATATAAEPVGAADAAKPDDAARAELAGQVLSWLSDPSIDEDATLQRVFAKNATAIDLSRGRTVGLDELAGRFEGARVVALVHFDGPPASLATELSHQIKQVEDVPAAASATLTIDDGKAKLANQVASEWIAESLQLGERDAGGVLALWQPESVETSTRARMILVAYRLAPRVPGQPPRVVRIGYAFPGNSDTSTAATATAATPATDR